MNQKLNPLVIVGIGTAFFVAYTIIVNFTQWHHLAFFLYFLSPFVMVLMVIGVLKGRGPKKERPFPYD